MLRNYIERRERQFHGRDNNRKSLPFEWGVEHLGLDPNGNPEANLREYVTRTLLDSPSFYESPPIETYEFDGHILTFPSAVETPYPENNTVWGRFVEGGRDLGVVVLPQWNARWE